MKAFLQRSWKVLALACAIVAVPTAGFAAIGSFTGSQGGAVALSTATTYTGFKKGPVFVPYSSSALTTMATLNISSAGSYSITAKAWVVSNAGTGTTLLRCRLIAGTDYDFSQADATDNNVSAPDEPVRNETLVVTIVHKFSAAGTATLGCQNRGGGLSDIQWIRITAVPAASLSKVTMT